MKCPHKTILETTGNHSDNNFLVDFPKLLSLPQLIFHGSQIAHSAPGDKPFLEFRQYPRQISKTKCQKLR